MGCFSLGPAPVHRPLNNSNLPLTRSNFHSGHSLYSFSLNNSNHLRQYMKILNKNCVLQLTISRKSKSHELCSRSLTLFALKTICKVPSTSTYILLQYFTGFSYWFNLQLLCFVSRYVTFWFLQKFRNELFHFHLIKMYVRLNKKTVNTFFLISSPLLLIPDNLNLFQFPLKFELSGVNWCTFISFIKK